MKTHDFYYDLPPELIAQEPLEPRDHSRLLALDRKTGKWEDTLFYELPRFLRPGDCLILNDSRVLPARLYGRKKETGAAVELLLLHPGAMIAGRCWPVPEGRQSREHSDLRDGRLEAEVLDIVDEGNRLVRFRYEGNFYTLLEQIGQMPLPHYITHELKNKERYQTVYSRESGSAAAPTAGLHFTNRLLERIRESGVSIGFVTLHVGLGTFRPVKAEEITEHKMHAEHYELSEETAALINRTRETGGRVIAVGPPAAARWKAWDCAEAG